MISARILSWAMDVLVVLVFGIPAAVIMIMRSAAWVVEEYAKVKLRISNADTNAQNELKE